MAEKSMGELLECYEAGQRYRSGDRTLMPFAAKLHHASADPFVLEELIGLLERRLVSQH